MSVALPTIQTAFILPTTQCPSACAHCFYEVGHLPRVEAANLFAALPQALEPMMDAGLQQVIISGGEPLLFSRLPSLVQLCSDRLLHVLLLTRGGDLDEERLHTLEQAGLDDLTLSVDRLTPPVRSLVQRVIFHSRYTPALACCLTRTNLDQVTDLWQFSQSLNLPLLLTPAFIPPTAPAYQELSLRLLPDAAWSELARALGPWIEHWGAAGYWKLLRAVYQGLDVRPSYCPVAQSVVVLDADGAVYPCFHRRDLCAGNLLQQPWSEIALALGAAQQALQEAPCFGEHCVSLFAGVGAGRAHACTEP